ncbi:TonB-linked SusC/RagA family outer membrane protein [Algoriphagus ratkowskyi]|uniref:TonB-linked SusC/RagA family outer membrane protein n=1 Tax=Algoriphagus ratkowskyi TaxID=57028 RepID=A0A2W7RXJ2_9BACT|nr:TonB-dependent receptor [Algoriphagus ratkowskyi]PZX59309.1 TonB-linked SusC/RagA family outer membrane protein [Algoriphagus ratkowskyi]
MIKSLRVFSPLLNLGFLVMLMLGMSVYSTASANELLQAKDIEKVVISMQPRELSIKDAFKEIEQKTPFTFFFTDAGVDLSRNVILKNSRASVAVFLGEIAQQSQLKFKQVNETISVNATTPSAKRVEKEEKVEREITGQITDEDSLGVPGVNVLLKGSVQGTITDLDGNYTLSVPDEGAVLVVSFIGFKKQEVVVGARSRVDIVLEEDYAGLDEVVVVGFGSKEREDISGAVTSVKMDKVLGDRPVTDAAKALQGTVPGLQITYGSGQPGASTNINIRGFTSINGGSPLVLVNNVPMSLDDVNPRDIEDVVVLKDASAASIYGAEAAFGVILITTKTGGFEQPMKLEYSNNFGFTKPSTLPKKASPLDFVTALDDWGQQTYWTGQNVSTWKGYINEYNSNPSAYPEGYITDPSGLRYYTRENDLYQEFLGSSGFEQIHNLSVKGGSKNTSYRISMGFNDEDGIMVTDKDSYKRYTANVDLTTQISPKISTTFNSFYKNGLRTGPIGGNWGSLYYSAINFHSATPIGSDNLGGTEQVPFATPANLIKYSPERENFEEVIRFFLKGSYKPLAGLEFNAEYTFEKSRDEISSPSFTPTMINPATLSISPYNPSQSSYFTSSNKRNYHAVNAYGKYNKKFGEHALDFMLGMNQQVSMSEGFNASRQELISPSNPGLSTATGVVNVSDFYTDYGIVGFFGRANYQFKEKYLLEANGRYDGSSRFPEGNRFGFFPSFSGAWKVSREPFMAGVAKAITELKLRGSWGEIGNQAVEGAWGNYPYLPTMNSSNVAWIDNDSGVRAVSLSAPGLVSSNYSWERVRTTNVGVDFGLFENKLFTTFDWYNRQTLDMLAAGSQLPAALGANAPLQNVADLKTLGWELDIKWRETSKRLNYTVGFNLYNSTTEITRFQNEAGLINQFYVGQKMNEIWGYTTDGFYTVDDFVEGTLDANLLNGQLKDGVPSFNGVKQNPGDIKYLDLNGDGVIFSGNSTLGDPGDRSVIGNSTRGFEYGVNGSLSFANFDLSLFLRGIGKRDVWINNPVYFPYTFEFTTIYEHQLDYWTPENTDAFYPRNYPNGAGNYGVSRNVQSKYLSNGAYLRLQNITLGYTLSDQLLDRLKITRFRMYVSGENLLNFDHLPDGLDADLTGINNGGNYPFIKKISFGLNVTL